MGRPLLLVLLTVMVIYAVAEFAELFLYYRIEFGSIADQLSRSVR